MIIFQYEVLEFPDHRDDPNLTDPENFELLNERGKKGWRFVKMLGQRRVLLEKVFTK